MAASRIDAYLDAMDFALGGVGDFQPRPFHIVEVTPYFLDLEAADMLRRLRRLDADRVDDREIAGLFPGANAVKTLLMDMVCGMKSAGIPAAERVWFTERMFDVMSAAETGDIFCRDGSHQLLTQEQAQQLADGASWLDSPELIKAAYRASASGQAMIWGLYFYAWTDMGWEIHGPYQVQDPAGEPAVMIVRDYFDLAPSLLWPEVGDWPMRTMRLVSLHSPVPEYPLRRPQPRLVRPVLAGLVARGRTTGRRHAGRGDGRGACCGARAGRGGEGAAGADRGHRASTAAAAVRGQPVLRSSALADTAR